MKGPGQDLWNDALRAAALFAVCPAAVGGVVVRGAAGPARDRWVKETRALFEPSTAFCRMPLHTDDSRLLGGLDLAATLRRGCRVVERGLLASADGGVLMVSMAERIEANRVGRICQVMDRGQVVLERDGIGQSMPARFGVIAFDEGQDADERAPAAFSDRLAFQIDLTGIALSDLSAAALSAADIASARARFARVEIPESIRQALCATALALGVWPLRASWLACQVARACAALDGRDEVAESDAALAGRLVLAHRATCLPESAAEDEQPLDNSDAESELQPGDEPSDLRDEDEINQADGTEERVIASARAAIPADLLARLRVAATNPKSPTATLGATESRRPGLMGGRPASALRGDAKSGARLHLIETLRAAAPWQVLRRREAGNRHAKDGKGIRIEVRREDFRVRRYVSRTQTTTIFLVDASGSAALHRLAETKGAVELLLAQCYIRRDQVAVLAFRQEKAELLLPPTRSLTRAKRSLAGMPASGGTPLAAALDAATLLADGIRRKGGMPIIVVLSDGRANVARDGTRGREAGQRDAMAAAVGLRLAGITSLFVDTSPNPSGVATSIAEQMGAQYLPLPYADAIGLSDAVRAVSA